ncbi:bifunctional hydroxymethylpyrimidine kinase/phosphomethylpyrimidine kinase [Leptolyngbya sp. KIOST-1]|uniref:bifunctional hydroxymethylpyrimidine kinase/phosphomethylpyrimidine kinase n=1 Tax=Leptolyngbya sp. KIOST-1 TaxID=1229172 RepID=UPI000567C1EC|nr:bifunctional hydroxymethylpyrimidine kinase/phosphomethylpyrimidine kinase [Leptolyngbya sp. KIOST-1]
MTPPIPWPTALTIAGSDSGGGAGIQADLRTFAFHRVHGTSALTCVTAQNTLGVTRVDALAPEAVVAQLDAITSDIAVQAIKTGMLLNQDIIQAVATSLEQRPTPVVVDPVMVSRTGAQLIDDNAIAILIRTLIPQAHILTPNRHEAQLLSGLDISTLADMEAAARRIHQLGPQAVLVKGGGMGEPLRGTDVWFDGHEVMVLATEAVDTRHTHGTGCTLSAAIAANLALGKAPLTAAKDGKDYVTRALNHALAIGQGQGPVGHFFPLLVDQP